jgi:hypothetical protein
MLGFLSAHIPWNAIKLSAMTSIQCITKRFGVTSASTLRNICRREYTATVDAIEKQLPSRNKASLALDG